MSSGFRHTPVPALVNSAEWALRPVITGRDRVQALAFRGQSSRWRSTHRQPLPVWYLVEQKIERRLLGLLEVAAPACGRRADIARFFPAPDATARADLPEQLAALIGLAPDPASSATLHDQHRDRIAFWSAQFEVPANYPAEHQLQAIFEPTHLHYAGRDYVGRSIWLEFNTRVSWLAMQRAALEQAVQLDVVSAFRSIEYQADIWTRKRARGQSTTDILSVNVPPGYSEHHSGRAIDLSTPGTGPAEISFADTAAFRWLQQHAHHYGFHLSFPEHNPHGVMYEPWHWCHH